MFLVRVALGIEETSDLLRRSLDELLLLLHDLGDTRETIDLGIHIIDDLLLEILVSGASGGMVSGSRESAKSRHPHHKFTLFSRGCKTVDDKT